jgi:predicted metal-dependent hydrolase
MKTLFEKMRDNRGKAFRREVRVWIAEAQASVNKMRDDHEAGIEALDKWFADEMKKIHKDMDHVIYKDVDKTMDDIKINQVKL